MKRTVFLTAVVVVEHDVFEAIAGTNSHFVLVVETCGLCCMSRAIFTVKYSAL